MPSVVMGSDTNPGGRKYNEDRCGVGSFVATSGIRLSVAVVCDGVGGEKRGERAAQLAIDAFFDYLRRSDLTDTPKLLSSAVRHANLMAFNEAEQLEGGERMAATMVAAVIEADYTLYIANVGDSRIYLCRDGQLRQLTRDHNFANVMVWMEKLSAEAAANSPDANKVMRALGTKDNIQVDVGIYLDTTDYGEANRIGREGFKLHPGDSILLCSDGLIKPAVTTGKPLVTEKEIVRVLQTEEGNTAARAIMSVALGRIPVGERVDNITLALLQTEDSSRVVNQANQQEKQQREQRRKTVMIAAAVAIPMGLALLATLAAFAYFFTNATASAAGTATQLAQATAVALAQTQTVAAFTPTPTATNTPAPTPAPTLAPGEIAKLYDGDALLEVIFDDKKLIAAPTDEARFVVVNHRNTADSGDIYLQGGSQFQFSAVTDPKFQLKLLAGSDVFIQTGPYQNGAEIELAGLSVVVSVRGCLAAYYADDNNLLADCFEGVCGFSINFGSQVTEFERGQQIQLDINQLRLVEQRKIPAADSIKYWKLLAATTAGKDDIDRCRVPPPDQGTATQPTLEPIATRATAEDTITPALAPGTALVTSAITATPTPDVAATATADCQQLQQAGTPCP